MIEKYLNEDLAKVRKELIDKSLQYFDEVVKTQSNCEHQQLGQHNATDKICLNCGLTEIIIVATNVDFEILTSEFHKPLTNGEWYTIQDYFSNPIGIINTKW